MEPDLDLNAGSAKYILCFLPSKWDLCYRVDKGIVDITNKYLAYGKCSLNCGIIIWVGGKFFKYLKPKNRKY